MEVEVVVVVPDPDGTGGLHCLMRAWSPASKVALSMPPPPRRELPTPWCGPSRVKSSPGKWEVKGCMAALVRVSRVNSPCLPEKYLAALATSS